MLKPAVTALILSIFLSLTLIFLSPETTGRSLHFFFGATMWTCPTEEERIQVIQPYCPVKIPSDARFQSLSVGGFSDTVIEAEFILSAESTEHFAADLRDHVKSEDNSFYFSKIRTDFDYVSISVNPMNGKVRFSYIDP